MSDPVRRCPHCNGALSAPLAHRGELERQLGDVAVAENLRMQAKTAAATNGNPVRLVGTRFIAWRGYVWAMVRVRKSATCCVMGVPIPAGARAWRQLSEVKDRDLRVAEGVWSGVA